MPVSIIHTADWQIGKQFANVSGDAGAVLREQRFHTVRRIADVAREREVDAVLVAGDVFDSNAVKDETVRRTINAMEGFAGPWVLLPGNHDAALAESVWTRMKRWGTVENLVLATSREPIVLANGGMIVLPAPLRRNGSTLRKRLRPPCASASPMAALPAACRSKRKRKTQSPRIALTGRG